MLLSMYDFLPGCLFAVVVIKCFMIGVNVLLVYLAPQKNPRAISVSTFGNKVVLYRWLECFVLFSSACFPNCLLAF